MISYVHFDIKNMPNNFSHLTIIMPILFDIPGFSCFIGFETFYYYLALTWLKRDSSGRDKSFGNRF